MPSKISQNYHYFQKDLIHIPDSAGKLADQLHGGDGNQLNQLVHSVSTKYMLLATYSNRINFAY